MKNRDEMFAFLRCWRVVRLTKTSTLGGPWDLILELIFYLWTSFWSLLEAWTPPGTLFGTLALQGPKIDVF